MRSKFLEQGLTIGVPGLPGVGCRDLRQCHRSDRQDCQLSDRRQQGSACSHGWTFPAAKREADRSVLDPFEERLSKEHERNV